MKKTFILLFALCGVLAIQAQTAIVGVWNTGQENTKVEIKEAGSQMEGTILSSNNEKVVGTLIIKNVQPVGEAYKGQLYAIKKDRWVDAVFKPEGEKLTITVSSGWRSKTVEWTASN
ncbi:MAG: hypothetical protein AAGJ93_17050 [Bacteroidota bacterium]